MTTFDRITSDPARLGGQPTVRGRRLPVRRVLDALALDPDRDELFREYRELEPEDIRRALASAAGTVDDKVVDLAKTA